MPIEVRGYLGSYRLWNTLATPRPKQVEYSIGVGSFYSLPIHVRNRMRFDMCRMRKGSVIAQYCLAVSNSLSGNWGVREYQMLRTGRGAGWLGAGIPESHMSRPDEGRPVIAMLVKFSQSLLGLMVRRFNTERHIASARRVGVAHRMQSVPPYRCCACHATF
jgi:hypothetical protein